MLFPINRLFNIIHNFIRSCIPNVFFWISGVSEIVHALSWLLTITILLFVPILVWIICIVVVIELVKYDYLFGHALVRAYWDTFEYTASTVVDDTISATVNDTMSTVVDDTISAAVNDTMSTVVDDTISAAVNDTMSTSLSNIYIHKKPTKIITIHEDNIPLHFPVQQHPRHQAVHMWLSGSNGLWRDRYLAINHPTCLCSRNNPLLLGYSPRIDLEAHDYALLHWNHTKFIRIGDILFEFSECAHPIQPTHVNTRYI